jgi:hypothetical protein
MNEKNSEDDIEGAAYRARAVARAVKECAQRPQRDWPDLVKRMASPGFAQVFGMLLLEKDKLEATENSSETREPKEDK